MLYEIGRDLRHTPALPLGRRGETKGEEKEADNVDDIDWSDEYEDDTDSEVFNDSRPTTPTPPAA